MEQQSESICHDHLATLFQLWIVSFISPRQSNRGHRRLDVMVECYPTSACLVDTEAGRERQGRKVERMSG